MDNSNTTPQNAGQILEDLAKLFFERNAVYKDNYLNIGQIMVGLFPRGITLLTADDHIRFHLFLLNAIKMSRYANNWDQGGHGDSLKDGAVYQAMLDSVDQTIAAPAEQRLSGFFTANTPANLSLTIEQLAAKEGRHCAPVEPSPVHTSILEAARALELPTQNKHFFSPSPGRLTLGKGDCEHCGQGESNPIHLTLTTKPDVVGHSATIDGEKGIKGTIRTKNGQSKAGAKHDFAPNPANGMLCNICGDNSHSSFHYLPDSREL